MAKERIQMPQSGAGLIRYFEESADAIKLKPEHVVIICVAIIAMEIALKVMTGL
jgi:preprotein translocase subunit Sec61beta